MRSTLQPIQASSLSLNLPSRHTNFLGAARPQVALPLDRSKYKHSTVRYAGPATSSQVAGNKKPIDVVALGNVCVDIVLLQDELPPEDVAYRRALLDRLTLYPPAVETWEVGAACNFMIASARLGMHVASVGHVGDDSYGKFLEEVLQRESISNVTRIAPEVHGSNLDATLVCYVFVDPASRHAFCSRYDFGPWPLLDGITTLPSDAVQVLRSAKAVFTTGYVFDELPLEIVCGACNEAIEGGAAVFFDPGPRCFTMMEGARRQALETVMDLSDVVLMTEEEAKIVTGHDNADLAAQYVLSRPLARTRWCVVKRGAKGALLRSKHLGTSIQSPGYQVEVKDTVGCGDSFASAVVMGYVNDLDLPTTLALANAVGAATATKLGAGRNVATAEKVQELLQQAAAAPGEGALHAQAALDALQASIKVARDQHNSELSLV